MVSLKFYKLKEQFKGKLVDFWYWSMKPIAYFFTSEKEKKRYEKKKAKITEQQAIKWIAEDIMRYVIKNKSFIEILICDDVNENYFWNDCSLTGCRPYYIKRNKSRMAFSKFKRNIEFQEKIIDYIRKINAVVVKEEVEKFTSWQRITNYKKTVTIKMRK